QHVPSLLDFCSPAIGDDESRSNLHIDGRPATRQRIASACRTHPSLWKPVRFDGTSLAIPGTGRRNETRPCCKPECCILGVCCTLASALSNQRIAAKSNRALTPDLRGRRERLSNLVDQSNVGNHDSTRGKQICHTGLGVSR